MIKNDQNKDKNILSNEFKIMSTALKKQKEASGLVDGDYFKTGFIGSSWLKRYLDSPEHFFKMRPKDQTRAMIVGTALHERVLEPIKFKEHFGLNPFNGSTKDGKSRKAELIAAGKISLNQKEWNSVQGMYEAIHRHPKMKDILEMDIVIEEGHWMTDPESGLVIQVKPDIRFISPKSGRLCIVDLKKTQDASKEGFKKACRDYNYELSEALYKRVMKARFPDLDHGSFFFCMVEESFPHKVGLYDLGQFEGKYPEEWEYENITDIVDEWISNSLIEISRYCESGQGTLPGYRKDGTFVPGDFKVQGVDAMVETLPLPGYIMNKYNFKNL